MHAAPSSQDPRSSLLREGETCWQTSLAERATVLVDAADYFRGLRAALLQARHQILICGWDFDTRTQLVCTNEQPADGAPTVLGELLGFLKQRNPALQIHVVRWDYHWLYRDDREHDTRARLERLGIELHEDACHPVTGCVHHKVVIVDDVLAFCGGIDLTHKRWDTRDHAPDDSRRRDHAGHSYTPVHDTQLCLSGPIVKSLARYVREQWPTQDHAPPSVSDARAIWPDDLPIDFHNIRAGLSRTLPATDGRSCVREIECLYLAAIAGTQHEMYLENQYFTSERIARALVERLREDVSVQGLLVGLDRPMTAVEQHTMGYGRALFHKVLADAGVADRAPLVAAVVGNVGINVHSKLAIFDDRWLTVGSANLNRRSMGFDVECNIVLEAATEEHRRTMLALRNGLLAEHLGCTPEHVARLIEQHGLASVPAFVHGPRRLARIEPQQAGPNFGPILAPIFDRDEDWPKTSVPLPSLPIQRLSRAALFAGLMTAAAFTTKVVAEELPKLDSLQKLVTQLLVD